MDMIRIQNTHDNNISEACIYRINCQKCDLKKDLVHNNLLNVLITHRKKLNYNFDLKNESFITRTYSDGKF